MPFLGVRFGKAAADAPAPGGLVVPVDPRRGLADVDPQALLAALAA